MSFALRNRTRLLRCTSVIQVLFAIGLLAMPISPAGAQVSTPATPSLATPLIGPPESASPVESLIAGGETTPVLAYYSIRINPDSWDRAKADFPTLGRYSSDDADIMRQHIRWAKAAGIDGFIVSWRNTDILTDRLMRLMEISRQEDFKLVVFYLALNAQRERVPAPRIASDLDYFSQQFGNNPVFDLFGKPVVIWYGSWEFSQEEIKLVTPLRRDRLSILATERNPEDFRGRGTLFDGNAYYWSSANPRTYERYETKLQSMAQAVSEFDGLWIAPAAPGFDARLAGSDRIVERMNGGMLQIQLSAAMKSEPDAIGLISWNEFSDNTHVEPSCVYGTRSLEVVAGALGGVAPSSLPCGTTMSEIGTPSVAQPDPNTSLSVEEAESTMAIVDDPTGEPLVNDEELVPERRATAGAPTLRMATLSLLIVFGGFVGGCTMAIVVRAKHRPLSFPDDAPD